MHDALVVGCRETVRDFERVLGGLARSERPRFDPLAKRLTFEEFLDDVGRALVRPEIVHRHNVRMVELTSGARFLFEAAQAIRIGRIRGGQDFDGHVAFETRIARPIDFAHPARTQRREDFVRPHFCAGRQGHFKSQKNEPLTPTPLSHGRLASRDETEARPGRGVLTCLAA